MKKIVTGVGIKLLVIASLLLFFIVPLIFVGRIIDERERRSFEAQEEIIDSWGGRTGLSGPYLIVPVYRSEREITKDDEVVDHIVRRTVILFPETIRADTTLETEIRERGIYGVPVFTSHTALSGTFSPSRVAERYARWTVEWDALRIGLSVRNPGGIRAIDAATVGGTPVSFSPTGEPIVADSGTISAAVDAVNSSGNESIPFEISMRINGGGSWSIMPVARQTEAVVHSDWHAPSFTGSALPVERTITDDGFTAQWDVNHLSRNLPALVELRGGEAGISLQRFGVELYRTDDPYTLNDRSFKYAWLFLIVPFVTFFLFEVVRKRRIHAVQYVLAGSADVVFYLLLLSISEQIAFMGAYAISAVAITLLLAAYGSSVLSGVREGLFMGSVVAVGYGYLAIVLQSEDYALLLGSVGLFVVLATVMYLTRNVTWYASDGQEETLPEGSS